ncbi:MAG: DinB family protein [bacterium]
MIPRQTLDYFSAVPDELLALCAPHDWDALASPPGEGLRSIRDILVHMVGAEKHWIQHVIVGQPQTRDQPEAFGDLEAIHRVWRPQRDATVALAERLTAEEWRSRRPLHVDPRRTDTVDEIFWHVVTHEQYHRGQIFTRLALLGRRDLPDLDLLAR